MKTILKSFVALTVLSTAMASFATPVQFAAGQHLTADQLNMVATQANDVSEALGLADDGNAVVAPTQSDLNLVVSQAVAKSTKNCHQAICNAVVYLIPNQTYTIHASTFSLPSQMTLTVMGNATATIALGNAQLALGKNVSFININLSSDHPDALKKQFTNNQVTTSNVLFD
jgi:hypothetical protein